MGGDLPDRTRFTNTINPIVEEAAGGKNRLVRIYSEMADVLWSKGRIDAALALETLWHRPIADRKCSHLCGYSSQVARGERFKTIFDGHSHVMSVHLLK